MSEKQRPVYYEWNGSFIKGKGKRLPISFFKDKENIPEFPNIEDLKTGYYIGAFIKDKLVKSFSSTESIKQHKDLYKEKAKSKCKYYLYKDMFNSFDDIFSPILCNPKKVGTPKYYLINGQDIYSGQLREFARGHVMEEIKKCYYPYIKDLPVIVDYPIKIKCELHDTVKNFYNSKMDSPIGQPWDIDNYVYPYMKAFPDLLVREGKIRNDDRLHLPSSIGVDFVPIKNHNDRKLVFIISLDTRSEVIEDEDFKNFHNNKTAGFYRNATTGETEDSDLTNLNFDINE
jgi:hypothetical protein